MLKKDENKFWSPSDHRKNIAYELENEVFYDTSLVCKDRKVVRVCSSFLAVISPIVKELLLQDDLVRLIEHQDICILLPDIDSTQLKEILSFIISGLSAAGEDKTRKDLSLMNGVFWSQVDFESSGPGPVFAKKEKTCTDKKEEIFDAFESKPEPTLQPLLKEEIEFNDFDDLEQHFIDQDEGINQYSSENESTEDVLPPTKKQKRIGKKRNSDGKVKNTPKSRNPIEHRCAVCDYKDRNRAKVFRHARKEHPLIKLKEREAVPRYCGDKECKFSTFDLQELKQHFIISHQDAVFSCDQCDFTTNHSTSIVSHKERKHSSKDESQVCDEPGCGKILAGPAMLSYHKRYSHKPKSFNCEFCGYTCGFQYHLNTHMAAVHGGEKLFKCDECVYSTATKANLTKHINSRHLNIRYTCDLCDYTATRGSHINRHKKKKHAEAMNEMKAES